MKSTLADIKQLFNVKALAYSTTLDNLAEGQVGIFPEDSNTSIANNIVFATLPAKFRIISKMGGKYYYSLDSIEKARMSQQISKDYTTEQINIWTGTIDGDCNCMNGIQLNINIDEQSLIQRDGLTWQHRDFVFVVSPDELKCFCNCDGSKPVYENNVMTQLLYQKVAAMNSPFYTAEVTVPTLGVTTYASQAALNTAVPTPASGDMAIVTGTGFRVYNGTAWVTVGTVGGSLTTAGIDTIVAANKARNTDDTEDVNGPKLSIVIKGKPQPAGTYRDLEVNYVSPRGVKLAPSIIINGSKNIKFTETQALRYEIGAGYDMRAEEWDNMNNYTDLNYYTRLSDGIQSTDLQYQFENGKNYNTLTFEYGSKKSGLEDVFEGSHKQLGVLLATDDATTYTALKAIFIPA